MYCDSFHLDVSEGFINTILKHVDNLCDIIRNGDPSLERTTEVNENLNSAVSCYRSMLILTKQNFIQKKNQEIVNHNTREIIQPCQFDYEYHIDPKHVEDNRDEMESSKNDSDTDYKPKIENKAKKKSVSKLIKPKFLRPEKPKTYSKDIYEPIKDQQDSIKNLTGCPSPKPIPTKDIKKSNDETTRSKTETKSDIEIDPKFRNAKLFRNPNDIFLYPYVKYISEAELQCLCCNVYTHRKKSLVFRHLRVVHKTEINWNKEPEKLNDCETGVCKKLYGFGNKEMWCIQCAIIAKIKREESERISNQKQKNKIKELELCTECGKNVINLRGHMKTVHEFDKQKCPLCDKEIQNVTRLKQHIRVEHDEKLPCIHCGKLIMGTYMKRHIGQHHSSNEDKRHKCDDCGKGFTNKQHLLDHKNIHTGEKRYKCKHCSACFASRGNHGMHERSHLGHKRKPSK